MALRRRGQASAGLIDEAELTVSASVFGAVERALAYRSIGLALLDQGNSSAAGDYLKRSRDIYVSYLEAKSDPSGPLELDRVMTLRISSNSAMTFLKRAMKLNRTPRLTGYLHT